MSEFEFLIVVISILYSLVLIRVVNGAVEIIRDGRSYWLHTCWLILIFQGVVQTWWLFWTYRDVEWQYGYFLMTLLLPVSMYYVSAVLVPQDLRSVNWQVHFSENYRQVFLGTTVIIVINNMNGIVIRDGQLFSVLNIFPAVLCFLLVLAALSDSRRLHAAITIAVLSAFTMISILFTLGGTGT